MHIEFISKKQLGFTPREKRLIAIIVFFLIAMIAMIFYSSHLALALLLPIVYAIYQLRNIYRYKYSAKNIIMKFDFYDNYLYWSMGNSDSLHEKQIMYDDLIDIIFEDCKCTIVYYENNKEINQTFFVPQNRVEQFKNIIIQSIKK